MTRPQKITLAAGLVSVADDPHAVHHPTARRAGSDRAWLGASVLAAAETPSRPSLEKNSFYLSSAGFRVQVANDPAGQKALRALPAHRFVVNGVGDALRYFYAEPQHCVCIFVGTQQAYDRYRTILSEPLKPTD